MIQDQKRISEMFNQFGELLWDLDRNAEVVGNAGVVERDGDYDKPLPYVKVKGNIGANLSFEGVKSEKGVAYRDIEIREHLNSGNDRMLVGYLNIHATTYDNENHPMEKPYLTVVCGTPKCATTYQNLVPRRLYEVEGNNSSIAIAHHADESEEETMAVVDNLFSAISKSKEQEKIKAKTAEQSQDDGRTM